MALDAMLLYQSVSQKKNWAESGKKHQADIMTSVSPQTSKQEMQLQLTTANFQIRELKRQNAALRQSLSVIEDMAGGLRPIPRSHNDIMAGGSTPFLQPPKAALQDIAVTTLPDSMSYLLVELAEGVKLHANIITRLSKEPSKCISELMTALFPREVIVVSLLTGKRIECILGPAGKETAVPNQSVCNLHVFNYVKPDGGEGCLKNNYIEA
ncbi:uncharacterized protein [Salvelinus sp. IW2-2015]|uniref:uncharacterized protein isoform X2 n=1 Tax=Salvelinus sp. IW2-2015 TaxID=2691554 RepID=UPI000CDFDDC4|nr:uncharacterized protein LOC111952024 isoform X2 [Salvelinus alpinus]